MEPHTSIERRNFYFFLRHLGNYAEECDFTILGADNRRHRLKSYREFPEKKREHREMNRALALMNREALEGLTHFLEDVPMDGRHASLQQVSFPSIDDHPLHEIGVRFVHVPKKHLAAAVRRNSSREGGVPHAAELLFHGVGEDAVPAEEMDEVRIDLGDVVSPASQAKSYIFMHPEVGSVNPQVAQTLFDNHVKHTIAYVNLYTYIQNNPPGSTTPYYQKDWAKYYDSQGNEKIVPPASHTKTKCGKPIQWPSTSSGDPAIPQYKMSGLNLSGDDTELLGVLKPALQEVLQSSKNDDKLNGSLWTKQQGVTEVSQTNVEPDSPPMVPGAGADLAANAGANPFAVKNLTSAYGLDIYKNTWDNDTKTVTVPVRNWASRYLGAYVEFFRHDGTVIKRSDIWNKDPQGQKLTWKDPLASSVLSFLQPVVEPSDTKNYLDYLSSGNVIFGIPVPPLDQTAELGFLWPQEASSAQVLLGGLGVADGFRDWDSDVDVVGVLGTSIAGYGFTALSLVFTVKVANPFTWGLKGDTKFAFYACCAALGAPFIVLAGFRTNTSYGKWILTKLAGMAAGFIFGSLIKMGLKKVFAEEMGTIIAEATGEITAEQALEKIPIAGEILIAASVASDVAGLLATTIECFASPATYKIQLDYQMDLEVTVGPDPRHGKNGIYNWPAVADHWVTQVKYPKGKGQEGGTTYTKAGPMPKKPAAGKSANPIVVTFEKIPAGGKVEVVTSVYSENNWLAGQWNSGWFDATPDGQDHLKVSGNIFENLVPLTSDTAYSQKQTMAYSSADKHYWEVTKFSLESDLATDLDKGGTPDTAVTKAFADYAKITVANATITVNTAGSDWTLSNDNGADVYSIKKKQIFDRDGTKLFELEVQNTGNPGPSYVQPPCKNTGHGLCQLQNITINDKEYEMGYAWQASGMNLPRDQPGTPDNGLLYAMQSISTLSQPETQIIEPSLGFSNPTFMAYNQFGLTPLFPLIDPKCTGKQPQVPTGGCAKKYADELDQGGTVPAGVAAEFKAFKRPLPANAQVTVATKGKNWTIGLSGEDPVYELQTVSVVIDGKVTEQINAYSWPVPKRTNFYLDPRQYSPTNQLYYLRGVDLGQPFGQYTFDYDTSKTWGAFQDLEIQDMAVHPSGYVIAVDYTHHKLLALRLAEDATTEDKAPIGMPLSGLGLRDGLMNKPTAMTITADGRILVLEEGNSRIQAFDIKGNPVPCFSVDQPSFNLATTFVAALDAQDPASLLEPFQQNVTPALAPAFYSADDAAASIAALDQGKVDANLEQAFIDAGFATSHQDNNTPATVTSSFSVSVNEAGKLWIVTVTDKPTSGSGPTQSVGYDVRVATDGWGQKEIAVYRLFTLAVQIKAAGKHWKVTDTTNAMTFDVTQEKTNSGSVVKFQQLVSVMPLAAKASDKLHYLDVAVETKGYIYVLYQKDAPNPTFYLQLYSPDGEVLTNPGQEGVNAAKLTVDQWRSMFTLNFQPLLGPGQRTEPGVSQWEPSTPKGPTGS